MTETGSYLGPPWWTDGSKVKSSATSAYTILRFLSSPILKDMVYKVVSLFNARLSNSIRAIRSFYIRTYQGKRDVIISEMLAEKERNCWETRVNTRISLEAQLVDCRLYTFSREFHQKRGHPVAIVSSWMSGQIVETDQVTLDSLHLVLNR